MSSTEKKQPRKRANAAEASGHKRSTQATTETVAETGPVVEVADEHQAVVRVDGALLPFRLDGSKPLVRDEDYARWLGFERPRKVRELVRRMIQSGKLRDVHVRPGVGRTSMPNGGTREVAVSEFWLTETQALLVATQSDTKRAWAMTEHIVAVFETVTRKDSVVLTREQAEREFLTADSRARELGKLARLAAESFAHVSSSSVEQLMMIAIEGAKGAACYGGTGRELGHATMEQFWSMRSALLSMARVGASIPKSRRRRKLPKPANEIVNPAHLSQPELPLTATLDLPTARITVTVRPKEEAA